MSFELPFALGDEEEAAITSATCAADNDDDSNSDFENVTANNNDDGNDDDDDSFESALEMSLSESLKDYSSQHRRVLCDGNDAVLCASDRDASPSLLVSASVARDHQAVDGSVESRAANNNRSSSPTSSKAASKRQECARPTVLCITFNQDKNCVAIGTTLGYRIRTITPHNGSSQILAHQVAVRGGVSFVQMLHSTSLLAIVKVSSPRVMNLVNARSGTSLRDLPFTAAVRRVVLNKVTVVILTADGMLHLFALQNGMKLLKSISILHAETESVRTVTSPIAATHGAFFDLSSSSAPTANFGERQSWLVAKCSKLIGMVSVYDTNCKNGTEVKLVNTISAHGHAIIRVAIGRCGGDDQRVATASHMGTYIRVFSIPKGAKLFVLHRGSSSCTIQSLCFNFDASRLAVSSSKGTAHIFHLLKSDGETAAEQASYGGSGSGDNVLGTDGSSTANSSETSFSPTNTRGWLRDGLSSSFTKLLLPASMMDKAGDLRSYARIKLKTMDRTNVALLHPPRLTPSSLDHHELDWQQQQSSGVEQMAVVCMETAQLQRFVIAENGRTTQPVKAEDLLCDDDDDESAMITP